ncbi:21 kDa protein-like [Cornus florida]|uniref:21 kDa protein-like n=1 Tax=Cornus florida TaxID=4283 RepID=UPI00289CEDFC|nr:21 kDa protein-like [Cornus florida]
MENSYISNSTLTSILIFLLLVTYMNSSIAMRPIEKNTKFIKSSCSTTIYPQLCYSSLSSYASRIQTSPKLLANTALSVTLEAVRSTPSVLAKVSKTHHLKPREAAAISDCVEELTDAVEELQNSMEEMGQLRGKNFGLKMNDIQTWVSAALTNEDTCMEGFAGKAMNGSVKATVRGRLVSVAQLTSNALALINYYASLHTKST